MMTQKGYSHRYTLSRRDFLKLGGLGMCLSLDLFFPSLSKGIDSWLPSLASANTSPGDMLSMSYGFRDLHADQQGRVLDTNITVYNIPSFQGEEVRQYWLDAVIPITDVTITEDSDSHNQIWYRISDEGYAHSGSIQPVRTVLNPPTPSVPRGGILGEVTVPYTDARWAPGKDQPVAYRFYYGTTYWVIQMVNDKAGTPWYSVLDDKWEFTFFVPATHLRLIPENELTPISPDVHPTLKRLEVRIPEQVLIAYEFKDPVFMARVATGAKFSNGDFSTPLGSHITFHKRPSRHMAAGNLAANGYDLPGVPWNSYITESGIAFHGTYWHNNFGRPRSHGCINLTPQAAKWVYRWTLPQVPPDQQSTYETYGTRVDIIG